MASKQQNTCGIFGLSPRWLQSYATTRCFLIVYGFLGTTQAMGYLYFVVTLTTIEKRFKIPSQTTGESKGEQYSKFNITRITVGLKESMYFVTNNNIQSTLINRRGNIIENNCAIRSLINSYV